MMLCKSSELFSDPAWIYELKLDGCRCKIIIKDNKITLINRDNRDITYRYPEVSNIRIDKDMVLDSEIVIFNKRQQSEMSYNYKVNKEETETAFIKAIFDGALK